MPRTLLRGGVVLDVRAGATSVADVVVEGDRIVDVGVGLDGDDSVDCTGHLLVPGFIDCHTHLVAHDFVGDDFFETARSMRVLCAVPVLTTLLRLGVTTVRDAWGADAGLKRAVELGWIDGPEVLISLRQVCTTGGIGDLWSPRIGPVDPLGDPGMPDPVFDGVDAARAVVRRMTRAGADWIKVTATGSILQGARAQHSQITPDEMAALVSEAQRQGRAGVMVHAHGARAAEEAAHAGARSVEHGVFLDEAAVVAMSAAGTWLVPTLSISQTDSEKLGATVAAAHRASVRLALDAGVPIAMGTDNPVRPHTEVLTEVRHLSQAGLGDAGALRAATFEAARLLDLADDRGEIAPGKRADLVLLAGTDLDVDDLAGRIRQVWHNGTAVRTDRRSDVNR
ncbi:amidohydrolase family protein [Virgisporangium aurantiacum]|nr:amidohydrolase family protein [Virgisporangium aurantiacum]